MTEELKGCRCGSQVEIKDVIYDSSQGFLIFCENCKAVSQSNCMNGSGYLDKKEFVKRWNNGTNVGRVCYLTPKN